MMKKVYYDQSEVDGCVGIFSSKAEVIPAGTMVNAMPIRHKEEVLRNFSEELDIQFIFEDRVPWVNFYAVPYLEVIATDSSGGYIGILGEDAPVVYVDRDRKCYQIAPDMRSFIGITAQWKNKLIPYDGLAIYPSKEAAQKELEFIDVSEIV